MSSAPLDAIRRTSALRYWVAAAVTVTAGSSMSPPPPTALMVPDRAVAAFWFTMTKRLAVPATAVPVFATGADRVELSARLSRFAAPKGVPVLAAPRLKTQSAVLV